MKYLFTYERAWSVLFSQNTAIFPGFKNQLRKQTNNQTKHISM